MASQSDRGIAGHRKASADGSYQQRIDNGSDLVRLVEYAAEIVERHHVGEIDAFAPLFDKGTQRDARDGHDDGKDEPQRNDRKCDPFPSAKGQKFLSRRLAFD